MLMPLAHFIQRGCQRKPAPGDTQRPSATQTATRTLIFIKPNPQNPAAGELELELELVQSHMAQTAVLRGEVGCACVAREVSVEKGGMGDKRRKHN